MDFYPFQYAVKGYASISKSAIHGSINNPKRSRTFCADFWNHLRNPHSHDTTFLDLKRQDQYVGKCICFMYHTYRHCILTDYR